MFLAEICGGSAVRVSATSSGWKPGCRKNSVSPGNSFEGIRVIDALIFLSISLRLRRLLKRRFVVEVFPQGRRMKIVLSYVGDEVTSL